MIFRFSFASFYYLVDTYNRTYVSCTRNLFSRIIIDVHCALVTWTDTIFLLFSRHTGFLILFMTDKTSIEMNENQMNEARKHK